MYSNEIEFRAGRCNAGGPGRNGTRPKIDCKTIHFETAIDKTVCSSRGELTTAMMESRGGGTSPEYNI